MGTGMTPSENALSRREFLYGTGLGAASLAWTGVPSIEARANRPPNVVLIITDDQGYGDLGCHGNPTLKTPNLDALYGQSVRLTNFHVDPTCSPTRAALMTGRYSPRTGVWHTIMGRSLLRRDEVTMAEVFFANGYRTGLFGKWHLGDNYPYRPQDRGFDEVLMHGGGGVGQTPDYWGNGYFDDTYFRNGIPEKRMGYCTDVWFQGAKEFIETHRDVPFFCYLSTNAPHSPYRVPEVYRKEYPDAINPEFYGMIANIDENIGKLLSDLQKLGLEEDTLILFMTDNGSSAGARLDGAQFPKDGYNAGMRGMKGSVYDGGHRVPCFLRWPGGGLDGGRVISQLTAHIDILPTLIDLCGLRTPKEVVFDGHSLAPFLYARMEAWPERTIVIDNQRVDHPEKGRSFTVMTERWRLAHGRELYDIRTDSGQREDVAKEYPAVTAELLEAYNRWWDDVSRRFDEYCAIPVGGSQANPVQLTAMDWHSDIVPWDQSAIRNGLVANGFWVIDVVRDGVYAITLRRWPIELDLPINAAGIGDKKINATKAGIQAGETEAEKEIPAGAREVRFEIKLKAGESRLQTWFFDDDGISRGAYYVGLERLS